ncbi:MAG: hypothetical protein HQL05_05045 [Nitrospirae bacterium]|uniref:hypothetical protein n=1 Tax=Candidatus Magnetobacterium casense TaxID=1455061 RepID=UPI00058DB586|nr:hypothetical protein [Candidatus Magnetobacterium casensis]MBF0337179.1 hypothetical protein [Nitrospirota bacterium]
MQLTDERETDFLARVDCANTDSFIAHAEIQSTNDPKMLKRMMRYFIHIYSLYELRVKQYVIFIGKDKMNVKTRLNLPEMRYKYRQKGKQEGLESGRVEGMQDTIELLLRARFGEEGLSFMPKIRGYGDTSRLRSITEALIKAQDIRDIEGLL